MDNMRIVVEGGDKLSASLKRAGEDIAALDHAQPSATQADRAKQYAPKLTGNLARSIQPIDTTAEGGVYSDCEYAAVIEFGSRSHNIAPQPYLLRGVLDTQAQWLPIYADEAQAVLDTVEGV